MLKSKLTKPCFYLEAKADFTDFMAMRQQLKKTLGIRSPLRGSDWRDVIHLDPIQAQEGGRVKYIYRRKSKELMITIPQGVREGQKIRLKGMGDGGKEGGEPGDLYLRVKIKKPLLEKVKNLLKI